MSYPFRRSDKDWFRLIPSRFPPIDVYERLGSAELRAAAQEIETQTNPRLISTERKAQDIRIGRAPPARLQNWNHAPFAYKNPEGTFLLDPNYGVMELVGDVPFALAFYLRRREAFLSRTCEAAMSLDMRLLQTRIKGRFVDLTSLSPDLSREDRWAIGKTIYESNANGALYRRADLPDASFLAVFDASVLEPSIQGAHYRFVWDGEIIRSIYDFSSGNEISRTTLLPDDPSKKAA